MHAATGLQHSASDIIKGSSCDRFSRQCHNSAFQTLHKVPSSDPLSPPHTARPSSLQLFCCNTCVLQIGAARSVQQLPDKVGEAKLGSQAIRHLGVITVRQESPHGGG